MSEYAEEIDDLRALADAAISGELCSLLLPAFVEGIQQDTGQEPTAPVREIARRVEREHAAGTHYTPDEIARILRAKADELSRAAN